MTEAIVALVVASYLLWAAYVWTTFRPVSARPTLERWLLTLLSPVLLPAAISLFIVGVILETVHAFANRSDPPRDES